MNRILGYKAKDVVEALVDLDISFGIADREAILKQTEPYRKIYEGAMDGRRLVITEDLKVEVGGG